MAKSQVHLSQGSENFMTGSFQLRIGIISVVGMISVVIGGHFGGGDRFDGGDHFGGGTYV